VTNLTIGITPPALGRPARLRADAIQRAVLVQLARAIAEGDQRAVHLIDALEDLGRLAAGEPRDGELDDALDDVAALASLGAAEMPLSPADVRQLAEQAQAALPAPRSVPQQRGAVA
jgi:hypothetical protein